MESTAAAIKIQSGLRRYLCRLRFCTLLLKRELYATCIQQLIRIHEAKKEVARRCHLKKVNDAATVIAKVSRNARSIRQAQFLRSKRQCQRAAITIQTYIRRSLAKMLVDAMAMEQLQIECAAIIIQTFVRTTFAKFTYISHRSREQREPNVLAIQRIYKVHREVKHRRKLINSSQKVQTWWRATQAKRAYLRQVSIVTTDECSINSDIFTASVPSSSHTSAEESVYSLDTSDGDQESSVQSCPPACIDASYSSSSSIESETIIEDEGRESDTNGSNSDQRLHDAEQLYLKSLQTSAIKLQRYIRRYLHQQRQWVAAQFVDIILDNALNLATKRNWHQLRLIAATRIQATIRGFHGRQLVRTHFVFKSRNIFTHLCWTYTFHTKAKSVHDSFYMDVMDLYHSTFSSDHRISSTEKPSLSSNLEPSESSNGVHKDIATDPFLSAFFKYLQPSSMPMTACCLKGVNLDDPRSMLAFTIDFSKD